MDAMGRSTDFGNLLRGGGLRIRIGGIGGQGSVLVADVLAHAGALEGLEAACSTLYGSQARGGATKAEVILSAEPIDFPHVEEPHIFLAMAQEAVDEFAAGLVGPKILIYDEAFVRNLPLEDADPWPMPATRTVLDALGKGQPANFYLLGALAGLCGCVGEEALRRAMAAHLSSRFLEMNERALALGLEAVRARMGGE